ncbi:MAG: hypothetical protein ACW972_00330 [Promethearchaeota archaeon]|jgi:hypothetical protein
MSNGSSKAVSIIALLFGIAGVSIGAINFILPSPSTQQGGVTINNVWSSEGDTAFHVPKNLVILIPNLVIDFTTSSGEDALFLFTASAVLNSTSGVGGLNSLLQFVFKLNGVAPTGGFTNFEIPDVSSENFTIPVTFFYTLYDFTAGSHNLSVSVYSTSNHASVYYSRLIIQTFNS